VDLRVFFLRKALGRLPEGPDATVVVGNLRYDILRVLREVLDDNRLGLFAGVRGEVCPRGDLASKEKRDGGD
jgi:hypothetical protein